MGRAREGVRDDQARLKKTHTHTHTVNIKASRETQRGKEKGPQRATSAEGDAADERGWLIDAGG